jgi:hypothetical protein
VHPGYFVIAAIVLFVYGLALLAVIIPISWLLRTRPGSPFRGVGFIITGLATAGTFGCGVYWWILAASGPAGEGMFVRIGAVLCWIATFSFGWLFLFGLGHGYKPRPPTLNR